MISKCNTRHGGQRFYFIGDFCVEFIMEIQVLYTTRNFCNFVYNLQFTNDKMIDVKCKMSNYKQSSSIYNFRGSSIVSIATGFVTINPKSCCDHVVVVYLFVLKEQHLSRAKSYTQYQLIL